MDNYYLGRRIYTCNLSNHQQLHRGRIAQATTTAVYIQGPDAGWYSKTTGLQKTTAGETPTACLYLSLNAYYDDEDARRLRAAICQSLTQHPTFSLPCLKKAAAILSIPWTPVERLPIIPSKQ